MKKSIIYVLAALCLATSCHDRAYLKGWDLVWADEFDSPQLDTTYWNVNTGHRSYYPGTDDVYDVKDGCFTVYAIPEAIPGTGTNGYISGSYNTFHKVIIHPEQGQRARIDVKAKMTSAKAWWPAIWMLDPDNYLGNGEIDIMERLNYQDCVYQTIHTVQSFADPKRRGGYQKKVPNLNVEDWNVYTATIEADSVTFYINGKYTNAYRRADFPTEYVFDKGMFGLILCGQLGGKWVGYDYPDDPANKEGYLYPDGTDIPASMTVDYCRYYTQPIE